MSTSTQALTAARVIQEAMNDYGVRCVIQLRRGASRSGWLTPMSTRAGVMSHHIVSSRAHGTTPFYHLVRNGRPGIPGPLANGYGGWDKIYRIITMGWANHPGAGGPITLAGRTVPRDNGRPYFWGTEYEGGLRASDWEREDFHGWMATCNAALLDAFNLPTSAHLEHLTWAPGRKIDRLHYTTESGRNRIAAVRGKPISKETTMSWNERIPPEASVANSYDIRKDGFRASTWVQYAYLWARRAAGRVLEVPGNVWNFRGIDYVNDNPNTKNHQLARAHQYSFENRALLRGVQDSLDKLADELGKTGQVDPEQVKKAARDGVAAALADLEADVSLTINTEG